VNFSLTQLIEYLQQRPAREQKILAGIGLSALFYVIVQLWLPEQQLASSRMAERDKLQQEISTLQATLDRLRPSTAAHPIAAADSAGASATLQPADNRISPVLEEMARVARATDVEVVTVRPQTVTDHEDYQAMAIHVELKAGFRELADYLRMLEELPRLTEVRSFKLQAEPGVSSLVTAELETLFYVPKPGVKL
jgi:type II secretory pathway component PulM